MATSFEHLNKYSVTNLFFIYNRTDQFNQQRLKHLLLGYMQSISRVNLWNCPAVPVPNSISLQMCHQYKLCFEKGSGIRDLINDVTYMVRTFQFPLPILALGLSRLRQNAQAIREMKRYTLYLTNCCVWASFKALCFFVALECI